MWGYCRNCGPLKVPVKREGFCRPKLNATYHKIHDKLGTSDAQRLVAAERLRIQYRDANCSAERELYAGGRIGPRAPSLPGSDDESAHKGTGNRFTAPERWRLRSEPRLPGVGHFGDGVDLFQTVLVFAK